MRRVEEMEGTSRPTPGLQTTIRTVLDIVRQSRAEATGPAAAKPMASADDLMREAVQAAERRRAERSGRLVPSEAEEDADLARIRGALYGS